MRSFNRLAFVLLLLLACRNEAAEEKTYALVGTIVRRDVQDNKLTIAHEAIPDYMEAMTMEFPVRGAKVADLPADGSKIEATLHVGKRTYYVTDVKPSSKG